MTLIWQIATLALVVASAAYAQSESASKFEVAAIKPSDPLATISFQRSGNRIVSTGTSIEWLIVWAYDIPGDRIYGKPAWLDSVRFDITANAEPAVLAVTRKPGELSMLQQMMQGLLRDRFHLALHKDTRERPVYTMIAAPGGLKVHAADPNIPTGHSPFAMEGRGRLSGTHVTAEMLAKVLSSNLGQSVVDDTGFKDFFDFRLEWEPDTESRPGGDAALPLDDVRRGSSIFRALQEQLGLKLEARKAPVEVLVIDRVDRAPSEN